MFTSNRCNNNWPPPGPIPYALDALDKSRDAVHGVAVGRHDAIDAALHVHQTPVLAGKHQMPALARAVVREWHLRKGHASDAPRADWHVPALCALLCPCGS